MRQILIVDTSIFSNVLDIPGYNQHRGTVLRELEIYIKSRDVSLLLPVASIVETGNHIGKIPDGRVRRGFAEKFVEQVLKAVNGLAPWTPTQGIEVANVALWLNEFPEFAMRGIGIGDLSIIKEFDYACERHPNFRIKIWTLDQHLSGYDRHALEIGRR